jgi:hypothetical protein
MIMLTMIAGGGDEHNVFRLSSNGDLAPSFLWPLFQNILSIINNMPHQNRGLMC